MVLRSTSSFSLKWRPLILFSVCCILSCKISSSSSSSSQLLAGSPSPYSFISACGRGSLVKK
uniref:Secreted protein n=1 Tax=Utricularia reniformis TaxID=192314 RepID=A0A1Y0B3C2_9LAMI|nr:hypothetical protein AEK19_MT1723 [Utricularia reniformis]ART31900.1 hypothetical protein AEK19_MT1723 [Utricularia reniformis]